MQTSIPYTVEHLLEGQTRFPTSAEVIERGGLICARVVIDGIVFINHNNGKGFASRLDALDFIGRTMREGATIA